MRFGIFGRGKMGLAVKAIIDREGGDEVAWVVDKGEEPSGSVDAVLDASAAEAVGEHLAWALANRVPLVIATTGWDSSILDPKKIEAGGIGVMASPNFSLSVAFEKRAAIALGRFAALYGDSSLAIVERHHAMKADAPSGTAKLLAGALAQGCARYTGWNQGRAEPGKINIASLRSGTEVGYHELRFETASESIVIAHEAKTRDIFAKGALEALRWIADKKGLRSFDEVAAEIIEPLFA